MKKPSNSGIPKRSVSHKRFEKILRRSAHANTPRKQKARMKSKEKIGRWPRLEDVGEIGGKKE